MILQVVNDEREYNYCDNHLLPYGYEKDVAKGMAISNKLTGDASRKVSSRSVSKNYRWARLRWMRLRLYSASTVTHISALIPGSISPSSPPSTSHRLPTHPTNQIYPQYERPVREVSFPGSFRVCLTGLRKADGYNIGRPPTRRATPNLPVSRVRHRPSSRASTYLERIRRKR